MAAHSTMTLSPAPSVKKLPNDEPIDGKFAHPVIKTKRPASISPVKGVKVKKRGKMGEGEYKGVKGPKFTRVE